MLNAKVALLTNFVTPNRRCLYEELGRRIRELRIYVSTPMERNRRWRVDWGPLSVTVQRTITFSRSRRYGPGLREISYVHVPLDTAWVLRRFEPDIIISTELGARTLFALAHRMRRKNTKILGWVTVSEHTERTCSRSRELVRRAILRRVDGTLVNGHSARSYVIKLGVPPKSVFFGRYTTDPIFFQPSALGRERPVRPRLLYVGSLTPLKGVLEFLGAISAWAKMRPERAVDFWVAGEGPLREQAARLVMPANISLQCLGYVEYDRLPFVYGQCDFLAFPTLADEWGLVVNEAFASGVPVLGSVFSQAVTELVEEGVTGWVFRPDCPAEIHRAIERALETGPEALLKMRAACRERASRYLPSIVADEILDSLERCRAHPNGS